jgi:hypothetical protein
MRAKSEHEIVPNYLIITFDQIIGKGCRDDVAVNYNHNSETAWSASLRNWFWPIPFSNRSRATALVWVVSIAFG